MEIVPIKPRSYCRGVVLAINKVLETKEKNPDTPVYLLGKIVHNQLVVDALERKGIFTIDEPGKSREELLDLVPEGIVLFSAHGVAQSVREKAERLGLTVVDATCPEVLFTDQLVSGEIEEGSVVFYVGKKGHPEATGICQGREHLYLIETEEDIPENVEAEKILVTNQTTLSVTALEDIFEAIKKAYPKATFHNEICSATRLRQEAISKQEDLDLLLVFGDPSSNNTRMLAQLGEERKIKQVKRIASIADLDFAWFEGVHRVGVTAGASTPPYIINQAEAYLKEFDAENPKPLPTIDLNKLLDPKAK